jgi:hypothetical protein
VDTRSVRPGEEVGGLPEGCGKRAVRVHEARAVVSNLSSAPRDTNMNDTDHDIVHTYQNNNISDIIPDTNDSSDYIDC